MCEKKSRAECGSETLSIAVVLFLFFGVFVQISYTIHILFDKSAHASLTQ